MGANTGDLHAQLIGNLVHFWKHVPDAQRSKGGNQDSVCLAPIGLLLECCEKTIMNTFSNDLLRLVKPNSHKKNHIHSKPT